MRSFIVQQLMRRQNGLFEKIAELEKTQYYSENEIKSYQEEKLQRLIKHAFESVPFYKELFEKHRLRPDDIKGIDDLEKIPIIEKETLRSNRERLLSTNVHGEIYTRRTGGSTGVPLSLFADSETNAVAWGLYYRFLRSLGYKWGDRILIFWGEPVVESFFAKQKSKISNAIFNNNFISTFKVNDQLLSKLISGIQKSPPKILRGYASSIYLLALKVLDYGLKIELNAVTTTAEKLYKFQREKIEEAFGNNVYDQYGCGETYSLAFECNRHNGLHVASEHVILELVDDKGEKGDHGNVIITNLDNYAMPIIRYGNGDLANWSPLKCDCKENTPLLKEVEGRFSDFIEGQNGNKVHAEFFTHIFGGLKLAERYSVKEFRIVQEKIDKLRIEFVTEEDLSKGDEKIINDKINEYLGNTEIEIKKVEGIPLTKLGKKMFVLSLLNQEKWEV
ncbi:MAG: phenylacetate--CoA ligase family protein [Deltaproteobacteria bacterium]|nr:phenylacetate--CoA ligase family protein [Deltaproteobacteria bacterium]